jgi:hypothetical protein
LHRCTIWLPHFANLVIENGKPTFWRVHCDSA